MGDQLGRDGEESFIADESIAYKAAKAENPLRERVILGKKFGLPEEDLKILEELANKEGDMVWGRQELLKKIANGILLEVLATGEKYYDISDIEINNFGDFSSELYDLLLEKIQVAGAGDDYYVEKNMNNDASISIRVFKRK